MQRELAMFIDDGVTGVAAALISHDDVILLCQQIDHAAFAFVAPVNAHDCTVCHEDSSYYTALMVEMLGTMSSSTSSRILTVSREVNMVTPLRTAQRRISMPSA